MPLRLRRNGVYLADLALLRRQVEANGAAATILPVTISHPASAGRFDAYLNLAFEPAPHRPCPAASLGLLGFRNVRGAWRLPLAAADDLPGAPALIDGSGGDPGAGLGGYAGLGHVAHLPALAGLQLGHDVAAIAAHAGQAPGQDLLDALARMHVVLAEALRFESVALGVNAVLVNEGSFRPSLDMLRAWDGRTLGSEPVSPCRHRPFPAGRR